MEEVTAEHDESEVGFRVLGAELDIDEVSEILGLSPTRYEIIGERALVTRPELVTRGTWLFECQIAYRDLMHESLSVKLDKMLSLLEPRAAALDCLREMGFEVGFVIDVFAESRHESYFRMEPKIVARAGAVGLPLDVRMHVPD